MADLLDRLDKEQKLKNKELKLEKVPALEAILTSWENVLNYEGWEIGDKPSLWTYAESVIPKEYSAKEILEFSLGVVAYEKKKKDFRRCIGLYLSALCNYCDDNEIIIHTEHFAEPPTGIGFRNNKKIICMGSVGSYCGQNMLGGQLVINGNAGCWICWEYSNEEFEGDKINAGSIIYLNGDYVSISPTIQRSTIYHKSKLIILKGIPLEGAEIKWGI